MTRLSIVALAVLAVLSATAAALAATSQSTTLTIYSGREERLVKPIFDRFEQQTGIDLDVRYGNSSELAATILEEGGNSPADVFFSQEAGLLGVLAREGILQRLPASTLGRVTARFRAPGKRWVCTSGRARVLVYNTDELRPVQLPRSVWELTRPAWKGKIGLPPTNASFQAFVAAMRMTAGENRTRDWLLAVKANDPKFYANNTQVVQAVGRGEILVGLVNHYYLYNLRSQTPDIAAENYFFPTAGDPGALVNCAGAGIVTTTSKTAASRRFVDFLLSPWAQRFIARGPGGAEYPLVRGVRPRPGLPQLGTIKGPRINLGRLGRELPPAIRLLGEVGYTT